jgi:hypothetical protein
MTKLAFIHQLYCDAGSRLSRDERIGFCASIIYTSHRYLSRYGNKLNKLSLTKTSEILCRAQNELSTLLASK